jgi:hypothetical protein
MEIPGEKINSTVIFHEGFVFHRNQYCPKQKRYIMQGLPILTVGTSMAVTITHMYSYGAAVLPITLKMP